MKKEIEFKPRPTDHMIVVQQCLQKWSKEKIIDWWKTNPEVYQDKLYKEKLMKWLEENLSTKALWTS